jgi:CheY-like chemotaxis protein
MQQAQKLESLGVLAGSVAHDFNNLLTGILTNASLIELKLEENQAIYSYLQAIMQAAEQAADITHQLLAYAGKGRFEITQLNLNDMIQNNMKLLQATLPKNIEFSFKPEPGLPRTEVDAGQIQQVVMNLMINAADSYSGLYGVVELETAVHAVTEEELVKWESFGYVVQVGDYIRLTVKDAGHGMDSFTLARIFDPFFTTKETGRGLGLAAVQGIIRGHHGALRVKSVPGSGTTFQVLLPISLAKPVATAVDSPADTDSGNRLILVVDDDRAIRNAINDILNYHGYQVLIAENGLEAVKLCEKYAEEISLILLDMTMPVLSGIETIHKLQEYKLPIPVLLMSGYDEKEIDPQNRPANLIGYLKKPFRVENLMGAIGVALKAGGGSQ